MKIKIEGHIYGWHFGNPRRVIEDFDFAPGPGKDSDSHVVIAPCTLELDVEMPTAEHITASLVQALREEKRKTYEAAAQKAAQYDERIERLLAITNEAPARAPGDEDDIPF